MKDPIVLIPVAIIGPAILALVLAYAQKWLIPKIKMASRSEGRQEIAKRRVAQQRNADELFRQLVHVEALCYGQPQRTEHATTRTVEIDLQSVQLHGIDGETVGETGKLRGFRYTLLYRGNMEQGILRFWWEDNIKGFDNSEVRCEFDLNKEVDFPETFETLSSLVNEKKRRQSK